MGPPAIPLFLLLFREPQMSPTVQKFYYLQVNISKPTRRLRIEKDIAREKARERERERESESKRERERANQ